MRCRQCGTRIPAVRTLMGNATCPRCGWTYRRRPASTQRAEEQEPQYERDYDPRLEPEYDVPEDEEDFELEDDGQNRLGPLPGDRRIWIYGGGALALILIVALILLLIRPGSRGNVDVGTNVDSTASVQTDATPDPDQEWIDQAEANLDQVRAYATGVLSEFQTSGETTVSYESTQHDVYVVNTADLVLTDFSRKGIVQAIQKIGEMEQSAGKTYAVGWRASFRDVSGSQNCLATFGSGFEGYTFTMNGKQYQYDSLEGMG